MNETVIEPAHPSDAAALLAVQHAAYQSEAALYPGEDLPPLAETLAELTAAFDRQRFIKAVADGRIIGAVRGRLEAETCLVGRLCVLPQYQGRGIGTRLLLAIEALFPEAVRFELFTGHRSATNLRLYHALGYHPCREIVVSAHLTLIFLQKPGCIGAAQGQ